MNIFQIKSILLLSGMLLFSATARADLAWAEGKASAWAPGVIDAMLNLDVESETSNTAAVTALSMGTDRSTILAVAVSTTPSGLADIGLWRFISTIRAQQGGLPFALLESNLRILEISSVPAVAPVPLPGAAWLLLTGLVGLVGLKAAARKPGIAEQAAVSGNAMPMRA